MLPLHSHNNFAPMGKSDGGEVQLVAVPWWRDPSKLEAARKLMGRVFGTVLPLE
jgi:hypothetical protein